MPNYSKGKIYKIVSDVSDKIYIGSTTQSLCKRLNDHVVGSKSTSKCASSVIIDEGFYHIVLIENFPCADRTQLEFREGQIAKTYPNRINNNLSGQTETEKKQRAKEYINCECGGTYQRRGKFKHNKTLQHEIYLFP
jgi:hypothetical protein